MNSTIKLIGTASVAIAVATAGTALHAQASKTSTWGTSTDSQDESNTAQATTQWRTAVQTNTTAKPKTAVKPGTVQSQSGVGTGATAQFGTNSSQVKVPDANKLGQQDVTGMNGQPLGQQNPKGLNGKSLGQQDPTGINGQPLGAHASGGGGPADRNGGQGINWGNGGAAGVSDNATYRDHYSKTAGPDYGKKPDAGSGGDKSLFEKAKDKGSALLDYLTPGSSDTSGGKPDAGSSKRTVDNFDDVQRRKKGGGGDSNYEAGDTFNGSGGGRNANGQLINKGNRGGGDAGGGQTDQANGTPGANATGQTINHASVTGNDAPLKKPKDATPIDVNKVTNHAIDPKRDGSPSGG